MAWEDPFLSRLPICKFAYELIPGDVVKFYDRVGNKVGEKVLGTVCYNVEAKFSDKLNTKLILKEKGEGTFLSAVKFKKNIRYTEDMFFEHFF